MRRVAALVALVVCSALLYATPTRAAAVGLEIAPLKYEQTIQAHTPQAGFIDVSNPSDAAVRITTAVQGFRQTGTAGDLAFFDSPSLSAAIKPDLASFTLGPREAVRVAFTVDPARLPSGGVYAAIFFQTQSEGETAASSYVSQSAKVGTLLILDNGGVKPVGGKMTLRLPFLQFGSGLTGSVTYTMPDNSVGATPPVTSRVDIIGHATRLTTGLVLPGSTRIFPLSRPGAYLGLIPIKLTDSLTGRTTTVWALACTGWYQSLLALLLAVIVVGLMRRRHWLGLRSGQSRRRLDGLSRRA